MIYISKKEAIEAGATHHGRLFGVPVWFMGDPNGDEVMAAPKCLLLQPVLWFCDAFVEMLTFGMPNDTFIEIPITNYGPIE